MHSGTIQSLTSFVVFLNGEEDGTYLRNISDLNVRREESVIEIAPNRFGEQSEIAAQDRLVKGCKTWWPKSEWSSQMADWGITKGEEAKENPNMFPITLPKGWKFKLTGNSRWTEIVDCEKKVKVSLFGKTHHGNKRCIQFSLTRNFVYKLLLK